MTVEVPDIYLFTDVGVPGRITLIDKTEETSERRFTARALVVEALELTWENWADIQVLVGVDESDPEAARGVWLNANGNPVQRPWELSSETSLESDVLGMLIPTRHGWQIARAGDWIIKGHGSQLAVESPRGFDELFEKGE